MEGCHAAPLRSGTSLGSMVSTWKRTIAVCSSTSTAASREFCMSSLTILAGCRSLKDDVSCDVKPLADVVGPKWSLATTRFLLSGS